MLLSVFCEPQGARRGFVFTTRGERLAALVFFNTNGGEPIFFASGLVTKAPALFRDGFLGMNERVRCQLVNSEFDRDSESQRLSEKWFFLP